MPKTRNFSGQPSRRCLEKLGRPAQFFSEKAFYLAGGAVLVKKCTKTDTPFVPRIKSDPPSGALNPVFCKNYPSQA